MREDTRKEIENRRNQFNILGIFYSAILANDKNLIMNVWNELKYNSALNPNIFKTIINDLIIFVKSNGLEEDIDIKFIEEDLKWL